MPPIAITIVEAYRLDADQKTLPVNYDVGAEIFHKYTISALGDECRWRNERPKARVLDKTTTLFYTSRNAKIVHLLALGNAESRSRFTVLAFDERVWQFVLESWGRFTQVTGYPLPHAVRRVLISYTGLDAVLALVPRLETQLTTVVDHLYNATRFEHEYLNYINAGVGETPVIFQNCVALYTYLAMIVHTHHPVKMAPEKVDAWFRLSLGDRKSNLVRWSLVNAWISITFDSVIPREFAPYFSTTPDMDRLNSIQDCIPSGLAPFRHGIQPAIAAQIHAHLQLQATAKRDTNLRFSLAIAGSYVSIQCETSATFLAFGHILIGIPFTIVVGDDHTYLRVPVKSWFRVIRAICDFGHLNRRDYYAATAWLWEATAQLEDHCPLDLRLHWLYECVRDSKTPLELESVAENVNRAMAYYAAHHNERTTHTITTTLRLLFLPEYTLVFRAAKTDSSISATLLRRAKSLFSRAHVTRTSQRTHTIFIVKIIPDTFDERWTTLINEIPPQVEVGYWNGTFNPLVFSTCEIHEEPKPSSLTDSVLQLGRAFAPTAGSRKRGIRVRSRAPRIQPTTFSPMTGLSPADWLGWEAHDILLDADPDFGLWMAFAWTRFCAEYKEG